MALSLFDCPDDFLHFDFDKGAFLLKRQHPLCYKKAFVEKNTFLEGKKTRTNELFKGSTRKAFVIRAQKDRLFLSRRQNALRTICPYTCIKQDKNPKLEQ